MATCLQGLSEESIEAANRMSSQVPCCKKWLKLSQPFSTTSQNPTIYVYEINTVHNFISIELISEL